MNKKAIITGITGQDGSYLAEYLLSLGYEVHGLRRKTSTNNLDRLDHLNIKPQTNSGSLHLHFADLQDSYSLTNVIKDINPDEVYNLAAQSDVRVSFDLPEYTGEVTGISTIKVLECLRKNNPSTRFYQASSSEMFGATPPPQNELTPFHPRSPYAVAKVYSYWATVNYREAYDLFATNGILFNHESPRRGTGFVTRKITREISRILAGKTNCIYLGNMDAKRDWGFAPEYVQCMHLMLQQNEPGDFVMGTGESYSVREFLVSALKYCGVEIEWKGTGVNELGVISSISSDCVESKNIRVGDTIIKIDPYYFRPTEVDYLMADISKSKEVLGWEPTIKCNDLIKIMMDSDLKSMNITPKNESLDILRNKNFDWVLDMNLSEVLN